MGSGTPETKGTNIHNELSNITSTFIKKTLNNVNFIGINVLNRDYFNVFIKFNKTLSLQGDIITLLNELIQMLS